MSELWSAAGIRRPKRTDAARNFDALIVAARTAFAVDGPTASLEEIARAAGVGIGTLYRNFPTRQHLYNSVYAQDVEQLCEVAIKVAALDPWQAWTTWLRRFVEFEATKRAMRDGIDRTSPLFDAGRQALAAAGEPLLRNAQEAGAVRDDISLIDAIRLVTGISRNSFDTDDQFDRVLGIAIDGLRPQHQ